MSINITSNLLNVNIEKEKKQDFYFSINHNALNKLSKLKPIHYQLFIYLCSKMSFNNAIVGVFHRLTEYSIAKEFKLDKTVIRWHLEKLEENKLIKIISKSPLIIQIIESPRTTTIETISHLLKYVKLNENEFNFNDIRFKKRKEEFYNEFESEYKDIDKENAKLIYEDKKIKIAECERNFNEEKNIEIAKQKIKTYIEEYEEPDFDPFK